MKVLPILLPLLIVVNGIVVFYLIRLELPIRVLILMSDFVAAGIVGWLLWRRAYRR